MSAYVIEYDFSKKRSAKKWESTFDVSNIVEVARHGNNGPVFQVVYKNGALVESVFDPRRSHFSINQNKWIFGGSTLEENFLLLRKMCSLWDVETQHVTSLITNFSLTDEYGKVHEVEVWEWKYKSALFLYWLSEWKEEFRMDDQKRQLVWNYFGHTICAEAFENPNTEHTTVRYLLNQIGSKVRINPTSETTNQEWEGTDDPPKPNTDEEETRI